MRAHARLVSHVGLIARKLEFWVGCNASCCCFTNAVRFGRVSCACAMANAAWYQARGLRNLDDPPWRMWMMSCPTPPACPPCPRSCWSKSAHISQRRCTLYAHASHVLPLSEHDRSSAACRGGVLQEVQPARHMRPPRAMARGVSCVSQSDLRFLGSRTSLGG